MPNWVEQLLLRFCTGRSLAFDPAQLQQQYLRIDLAYDGELEITYLSEQASLVFSLRIAQPSNRPLLTRMLHANHYRQQRPFSPTGHLLDAAIVLRTTLAAHALNLVDVDAAFALLLQQKHDLIEA